MNCDAIAPYYRLLEYCAFGSALEKRRTHFLSEMLNCRRALVLGDGDGRFTAALVKSNLTIQVDYLELSTKMIDQAQRRILSPRVRFQQADARRQVFPNGHYDLIVSHFFLDCLSTQDASELIRNVSVAAQPQAKWIISEFRQPCAGWRAWHARAWLTAMYFFFRLVTGLKTNRLPTYSALLHQHGFLLREEMQTRAGLIGSELWQS